LGLFEHLIPATEEYDEKDWALMFEGLKDTDQRIADQETTAPGYLFAVLLWPMYQHDQEDLFRELNQTVSVPKRISLMTTGIWELQYRLEHVRQHQVNRLLTHPYFRAAFDFLALRARTQEPELKQCVQWWTAAQDANGDEFNEMCAKLPKQAKRRTRKRSRKKHATE
jgi:poly(A) polymerase